MTTYSKPFLAIPNQVLLLQSRGLQIGDVSQAQECLTRIGYYRLSSYWYPFRQFSPTIPSRRDDQFKAGSRFEDAVALYNFDKELKLLVMDAIEQVEIALRVQLTNVLGSRGAFAYLAPAHLLQIISPTSRWKNRVAALADSFPAMPHAKLGDMGFPANWKTHAFWK